MDLHVGPLVSRRVPVGSCAVGSRWLFAGGGQEWWARALPLVPSRWRDAPRATPLSFLLPGRRENVNRSNLVFQTKEDAIRFAGARGISGDSFGDSF